MGGGARLSDGVRGRITEYATFNKPYLLNVEAFKYRLGQALALELGHPFYTDLQRVSWHAGGQGQHGIPSHRAAGARSPRPGNAPEELGRERRAACLRDAKHRAGRRGHHRPTRRSGGVRRRRVGQRFRPRHRHHPAWSVPTVRDYPRRGDRRPAQRTVRRGLGVRRPHRHAGRSLRAVRGGFSSRAASPRRGARATSFSRVRPTPDLPGAPSSWRTSPRWRGDATC